MSSMPDQIDPPMTSFEPKIFSHIRSKPRPYSSRTPGSAASSARL